MPSPPPPPPDAGLPPLDEACEARDDDWRLAAEDEAALADEWQLLGLSDCERLEPLRPRRSRRCAAAAGVADSDDGGGGG